MSAAARLHSSAPAPATRRARRHRQPSRPLEREEGLTLARLERAITLALADAEAREHCAQLSAYLDAVGDRERLEPASVREWLEVSL